MIDDHLGEDILLLDVVGQSIFFDYFVIGTGRSERQLKAMARAVLDVGEAKRRAKARNLNAEAESGWILLDLGAVIVHLFSPDQRDYYSLEELWSTGKVVLRVQ